jgi:pimeloyl-ACP methyl ester carboxylesterase
LTRISNDCKIIIMFESPSYFEDKSETLSFEEQFKNIEEVELPSGTAEVGDFTPEGMKDKMPVFLAPGWGCGLETYKATLKQFFDGGEVDGGKPLNKRRIISLTHPRIGGGMESSMNTEEFSKKYPTAELRKALNILEILEEKGIEQVDIVAHSEGALNIAIAASMYPEKFRSIVFFGPAGMMEQENWLRLGKGFAAQNTRPESLKARPADEDHEARPEIPINQAEMDSAKAAIKNLASYLAKNPGRSISEVVAMKKNHQMTKDLLPYLHDLGIGIAVMSAESDPVFPQEEVRKAAGNIVDTFISVRGGHGEIGGHPEFVVTTAEAALEQLAKKKKTPEQEQMLAGREYQAGVRYVPGEGLVIAPYVKKGKYSSEEDLEK